MSNGDHAATFYPSNTLFINHLNGVTYYEESGKEGGRHPNSFWELSIRASK
jgi:hypothetical protein